MTVSIFPSAVVPFASVAIVRASREKWISGRLSEPGMLGASEGEDAARRKVPCSHGAEADGVEGRRCFAEDGLALGAMFGDLGVTERVAKRAEFALWTARARPAARAMPRWRIIVGTAAVGRAATRCNGQG